MMMGGPCSALPQTPLTAEDARDTVKGKEGAMG